jgi:hypothetical protein
MRGLTARQLDLLVRVRDREHARPPFALDPSDSAVLLEMVPEGRVVLIGDVVSVDDVRRAVRIGITREGREAIVLAQLAGVDPS